MHPMNLADDQRIDIAGGFPVTGPWTGAPLVVLLPREHVDPLDRDLMQYFGANPVRHAPALAVSGPEEDATPNVDATRDATPVLAANEYRCAMCGAVYEKGWSDEDAEAEKNEHFAGVPLDECALVCDPCYQHVRPDTHPEQPRYRATT